MPEARKNQAAGTPALRSSEGTEDVNRQRKDKHVARVKESYTGAYLRELLGRRAKARRHAAE